MRKCKISSQCSAAASRSHSSSVAWVQYRKSEPEERSTVNKKIAENGERETCCVRSTLNNYYEEQPTENKNRRERCMWKILTLPYMTFISTQWLSSVAYILLHYYWHNGPGHIWWSWQLHGVLTEKLTKSPKILHLKWVEVVPIKYD